MACGKCSNQIQVILFGKKGIFIWICIRLIKIKKNNIVNFIFIESNKKPQKTIFLVFLFVLEILNKDNSEINFFIKSGAIFQENRLRYFF